MKRATKAEAHILAETLLALGALRTLRVWRNNSGGLRDGNGRLIRFGLKGSADIIGIMAPYGRFLAVETKAPDGVLSEQQERFRDMVIAMGGVYIVARSAFDAIDQLKRLSNSI